MKQTTEEWEYPEVDIQVFTPQEYIAACSVPSFSPTTALDDPSVYSISTNSLLPQSVYNGTLGVLYKDTNKNKIFDPGIDTQEYSASWYPESKQNELFRNNDETVLHYDNWEYGFITNNNNVVKYIVYIDAMLWYYSGSGERWNSSTKRYIVDLGEAKNAAS